MSQARGQLQTVLNNLKKEDVRWKKDLHGLSFLCIWF